MKKAYVFLADGFEETEAVFPADILRRAGISVALVSCTEAKTVIGAHGIALVCDTTLEEVKKSPLPDAVILPGGMPGAVNLAQNDGIRAFVTSMNEEKKIIAAICASPAVAFSAFGMLKGRNYTCYPGMEKEIPEELNGNWKEYSVVVDGNLVTSRGPGTAGEFGFSLVDVMIGDGASCKLRQGMLCE
ncbi:MAG: DJ-1/PfpI family protein [Treponemataceae bacterium]|nr:DJ-1/PfpI family protein [Treponemataceae bacterium]